jgi:hypothetical protein
MVVAAGRVGLPDLDQGAGDRPAIAVEHPARHDDPLTQRLARVLGGQVGVGRGDPALAQHRAGDLGQPVRQPHQRLAWVAQRG